MTDSQRTAEVMSAAAHWEALAKSELDRAAYEESLGCPYGDTSTYRVRADDYMRTARALRLEAETGKPHCSICLGDHPNHLHMHIG